MGNTGGPQRPPPPRRMLNRACGCRQATLLADGSSSLFCLVIFSFSFPPPPTFLHLSVALPGIFLPLSFCHSITPLCPLSCGPTPPRRRCLSSFSDVVTVQVRGRAGGGCSRRIIPRFAGSRKVNWGMEAELTQCVVICMCVRTDWLFLCCRDGKDEDVNVCACVRAEQTAPAGFLLGSPGQKTHESAASRIYSQLIKLAFVLRPGQRPVSINMHQNTRAPMWGGGQYTCTPTGVKERKDREKQDSEERKEEKKQKENPP